MEGSFRCLGTNTRTRTFGCLSQSGKIILQEVKIREFVKTQSCLGKISVRIKVFILRECMGNLANSSLLNISTEKTQVHVNF